jgi:hypothetical protein
MLWRREGASRDGFRVEDDGRSSVSEHGRSWFSGWFDDSRDRLVRLVFGVFFPFWDSPTHP